jgi:hypothetical protein
MPELYQQQVDAYQKITRERGGVVWMRVGTGKTRVGLLSAIELALTSPHVIVAIARREAFDDFRNEVATLQLPYAVIKVEDIPHGFEFAIRTICLVSEGMVLNEAINGVVTFLRDSNQIAAFIIDEAYLFKNPTAQKHKRICKWRYGIPSVVLSGSIMTARNLLDIYGQVELSGHGLRLAKGPSHFREQFMMGVKGHHFDWYPKQGSYQEIMQKIEPFTYVYMPRKSERVIRESILKVRPTEQQLEYFEELKKTAAIEGKFELTNMASIAIKAQQISDGWIKDADGKFDHIESTKVNRCIALCREIVESGARVVVWCAFREDIQRLRVAMSEIAPIATMQSGQPFKIDWWKSEKPKICIATEASGSSVNHFGQVPYGIYFSQDTKWLSLQQSQGRHDRHDSLHDTCYFTFLHTDKSLDAQVYYVVRASQSVEGGFIRQLDVLQWIRESYPAFSREKV